MQLTLKERIHRILCINTYKVTMNITQGDAVIHKQAPAYKDNLKSYLLSPGGIIFCPIVRSEILYPRISN